MLNSEVSVADKKVIWIPNTESSCPSYNPYEIWEAYSEAKQYTSLNFPSGIPTKKTDFYKYIANPHYSSSVVGTLEEHFPGLAVSTTLNGMLADKVTEAWTNDMGADQPFYTNGISASLIKNAALANMDISYQVRQVIKTGVWTLDHKEVRCLFSRILWVINEETQANSTASQLGSSFCNYIIDLDIDPFHLIAGCHKGEAVSIEVWQFLQDLSAGTLLNPRKELSEELSYHFNESEDDDALRETDDSDWEIDQYDFDDSDFSACDPTNHEDTVDSSPPKLLHTRPTNGLNHGIYAFDRQPEMLEEPIIDNGNYVFPDGVNPLDYGAVYQAMICFSSIETNPDRIADVLHISKETARSAIETILSVLLQNTKIPLVRTYFPHSNSR